ncbi:MAG: 2-oxoglutarate dehydrogenase complex dihydrolipoyllysine-residue succinyltransferase [Thermoanaerobaculales bacterium]
MLIEIKIPEIGESIVEGILVEWLQPEGAAVAVEDPLFVLETDKITMNIAAENAGRLAILVGADETVEVGQVVGTIDPEAAVDRAALPSAPAPSPPDTESPAPPQAATVVDIKGLSPAVQRLVEEHGIDTSSIEGTGKGGRILKSDVISFLEEHGSDALQPEDRASPPAQAAVPAPRPQPVEISDQRQTRTTMSRLRRRLAERLVEVQQTAAILTTFNEADMSRIMELRKAYKEEFKERHDVGLGFMSFFVKAVVEALKTVPAINAFIDGEEIVTNHYFDIGVAVSTDKGLVVPVIRDADRSSMAEIESKITDLARLAHDRSLELSDLTGAVFTISNGGVFGSLMSTPILNPPGSAILGMHTIQKRPVAINDEIVIRPMMYLAVSYDHRIIDGREAVTFLKRIVECIEQPERMLLEV